MNRLLNCPINDEQRLENFWTKYWEEFEKIGAAIGIDTFAETEYDSLTDAYANQYGKNLADKCGGKCQRCLNFSDLRKKIDEARKCCDKNCADAQPEFMRESEINKIKTGGK